MYGLINLHGVDVNKGNGNGRLGDGASEFSEVPVATAAWDGTWKVEDELHVL